MGLDEAPKTAPTSGSPFYGVPQGSVLGPLLFTFFVLPLGNTIRKHSVKVHGYADDALLYLRVQPEERIESQELRICCSSVLVGRPRRPELNPALTETPYGALRLSELILMQSLYLLSSPAPACMCLYLGDTNTNSHEQKIADCQYKQ